MYSKNKISIVVVTYHNDFILLNRLLRSIQQHWKITDIEEIVIILNDPTKYLEQLNKIVKKSLKKQFSYKIETIHSIAPDLVPHYNWNSQQTLKCLSCDLVNTDWYIIHDSKDYYIDNVEMSDIFDENGKATVHLDHTRHPSDSRIPPVPGSTWPPGPFSMALENSFKIFDIDPSDHKAIHFPTTTPFIVKTQIMRNMVEDTKRMTKHFFNFLFAMQLDGQCVITEFLLYGAYCYKTTKYRDYVNWNSNNRTYYKKVNQSKDLRIQQHEPLNAGRK